MEEKINLSKLEEILDRVSLHQTSRKDYGVVKADNHDIFFVVARNYCDDDMNLIAHILCSKDYYVRYYSDGNFLQVEENKYPTPNRIPEGINSIPITLEQGISLVAEYKEQLYITDISSGKVTVVCKGNAVHSVLSDVALKLSSKGLFVNYISGCNFLIFEEAPKENVAANAEEHDVAAV